MSIVVAGLNRLLSNSTKTNDFLSHAFTTVNDCLQILMAIYIYIYIYI